jgi:diguanylate cyclase (GGDEF)-like protein
MEQPTRAMSNEQLQRTARDLLIRTLQLWSVAFVVMITLAGGIVCLVVPTAAPHFKIDVHYVPQLASGLVGLVVLLNVYLIDKHRRVDRDRTNAIRELAFNESYDRFAVIDPLTQTFRRSYLNELLEREVIRANTEGTSITFLLVRHDSLQLLVTRHGREAAELYVTEIAQILRRTFRGSDVVVRYSDSEFLVVMPATTETLATIPRARLQELIDRWNLWNESPCEMMLAIATGEYRPGMNAISLIDALMGKTDGIESTNDALTRILAGAQS